MKLLSATIFVAFSLVAARELAAQVCNRNGQPSRLTTNQTGWQNAEAEVGAAVATLITIGSPAEQGFVANTILPAAAVVNRPGPGPVSPNLSRITATVLGHKVWPPGSLENTRPLLPADRTFHSLQVKITASEPGRPGLGHLAEKGRTLEIFSEHAPPADVVGKTIAGVITLAGDTDGLRWMLEGDLTFSR